MSTGEQNDTPTAPAPGPTVAEGEKARAEDSSRAQPRAMAGRAHRRPQPRRSAALYETIESAAGKLDLDVEALRARCRRHQTRVGDTVQSHLGGGIVAFKFGRSWRIRFPPA